MWLFQLPPAQGAFYPEELPLMGSCGRRVALNGFLSEAQHWTLPYERTMTGEGWICQSSSHNRRKPLETGADPPGLAIILHLAEGMAGTASSPQDTIFWAVRLTASQRGCCGRVDGHRWTQPIVRLGRYTPGMPTASAAWNPAHPLSALVRCIHLHHAEFISFPW